MVEDEKLNDPDWVDDSQSQVVDDDGELNENSESLDEFENMKTTDSEEEEEEGSNAQEVAEPEKKPTQSREENAQFQKMRQRAEKEAREQLEKERKVIEQERKQLREEKIERDHISQITNDMVEQVSQDYGVAENQAYQMLVDEAKKQAKVEKNETETAMLKAKIEKLEMKDKPYFSELESEIDQMVAQNPTVNVETAYKYLVGENLERLMASKEKNIKAKTEQTTLANVQDRSRRRNSPQGGAVDPVSEMSDFAKQAAIAMGLDPKDVAKMNKAKKRR